MTGPREALIATVGGITTFCSGLFSQVDILPLDKPLQYGVHGILAVVFVGLFYVIFKLIGGYKELADRWEGWETQRHEDQQRLNETLRAVTANCAAAQIVRHDRGK